MFRAVQAPLLLRSAWRTPVRCASGGGGGHGHGDVQAHHGHGDHHEAFRYAHHDELPIPTRSYKQEYARTNAKFNTMLAVSGGLFIVAAYLFFYQFDIMLLEKGMPPKAYRQRTNEFYKPDKMYTWDTD